MIHQVMLSGNIKSGMPFSLYETVLRVFEHVDSQGYNGFTLYSDGSFLTLYEGQKDAIEASCDRYDNTDVYSNIITLFSRPVDNPEFNKFQLGLGRFDYSAQFESIPRCFNISQTSLDNIFPENLPQEFQVLIRTFSRVNMVMTA